MDASVSQQVFRKVLEAMARPGRIVKLPDVPLASPTSNKYPFLILSTLLDHEVGFNIVDGRIFGGRESDLKKRSDSDSGPISDYLSSATGSREVSIEDADFVLIFGGRSGSAIGRVKRGRLEYPDESATLIYDVDEIGNDLFSDGSFLIISGPGMPSGRNMAIKGIDESEVEELAKANSQFPLGLDIIFSDKTGQVACLPRSVRVRC